MMLDQPSPFASRIDCVETPKRAAMAERVSPARMAYCPPVTAGVEAAAALTAPEASVRR